MKNGYNIRWTAHAQKELEQTLNFLEQNWTEIELRKFSRNLENTLAFIAQNPCVFPESMVKKGVRRCLVSKYNTLYSSIIE
jgi:plasmid stabilization system protein ParE